MHHTAGAEHLYREHCHVYASCCAWVWLILTQFHTKNASITNIVGMFRLFSCIVTRFRISGQSQVFTWATYFHGTTIMRIKLQRPRVTGNN